MVDISEQIKYWRKTAQEDIEAAQQLILAAKVRHGLFFAHLALGKLLKAHVCRCKQEIAPRIHNLVRLAQMSDLEIDEIKLDVLAEMNEFNIEGRYPLNFIAPPSDKEAAEYMKKASEVFQWLIRQL